MLLLINESLVALARLGKSRTIKIAKNADILIKLVIILLRYLCISTTLEIHYLVFIFIIYMASLFGEKGKVDRLDFFVILEYASQLGVNKDIETHVHTTIPIKVSKILNTFSFFFCQGPTIIVELVPPPGSPP